MIQYKRMLINKTIVNVPIGKIFKCKCCGECCNQRIPVIGKEVGNSIFNLKPQPAKENIYSKYYFGENGVNCEFMKENKCTIHKQRPAACRLYPFGIKMKRMEGKCLEIIARDLSCPGWDEASGNEHMSKEECLVYVKAANLIFNDISKRIGKKVGL